MRLYLLRHAEASYDAVSDAERELTSKGVRSIETLCQHIKPKALNDLCEVRHSGFKRARQTAELFLNNIKRSMPMVEWSGMCPADDPCAQLRDIDQLVQSTMLVGHNPHLTCLTGLLLTGEPNPNCIRFKKSGLLCLEKVSDANAMHPGGQWQINWYLTPKVF